MTWFQSTVVSSLKDGTLTITVPTVYARKWLSENTDKIDQITEIKDSTKFNLILYFTILNKIIIGYWYAISPLGNNKSHNI